MSYCTLTGEITALLLGLSPKQTAYIHQTVVELKEYALHPALLPTILHSCTEALLEKLIYQEHTRMYSFEAEAKGTDVMIINGAGLVKGKGLSNRELTGAARGILQRVTAWECHSKSLILQIEAVNTFVGSLGASTQNNQVRVCGEIIAERLGFISQKSNEMLLVAQLVKDRAGMQLAAASRLRFLISRDIWI
jgi:hypothetical protein